MTGVAKARFLRIGPRKVRLVVDMIRGKTANEALSILEFSPRYPSVAVRKLLKSAISNVMNVSEAKKVELDPDTLVIDRVFVDEGPSMKRMSPRAFGRADIIRKRSSHITIILGTK
ncbi:MAG: 50S ribosomal protein L22 [Candidatus Schekmanbacteria bacterium]|nr:50S ribosomal protein L22 [Candidatus Schekmanbacteria bacterium]